MSGIFESKRGGGQFQCKGTTRLGKKCKIKCESMFCYHHQFQELPKKKHIKKEECPICLEPIKNKIKLDCKHNFCTDCILKWFCNNVTCPYCRTENKNEELKKVTFFYGLNNKYICKVIEYKINISELDKSELDILEGFDIKAGSFQTKTEWEVNSVFLTHLYQPLFEKLKKQTCYYVYVKCTPETYNSILKNSPFYSFDN
jgi:hypothetical protein